MFVTDKIDCFFNEIKNKKVALIGIGVSNLPLIKFFKNHNIEVVACDKRTEAELGENAEIARESGAELKLGEKYLEDLDCDIILRTPGMRYYLPELVKLKNEGKIITSEMELFFDLCPCKIIAVTGSDGKTTTTTIISEFLKKSGKTVHLGGNIGSPLLPMVESINKDAFAVVELSSFQLISMRKSPEIAVVTNLSPNHLDMHKDMQEYIDSKKNIILHQTAFSTTVLNSDNEITDSFKELVRGNLKSFSLNKKPSNGAYLLKNKIIYCEHGKETEIIDINEIKIPGMHNVENYLAAISAVWGIVSVDDIKFVAKSFNGVEHRAEFVREINGIRFYNDSIASSPTRTASGTLSLYEQKIILISGGYDKNISYTQLGEVICNKVKMLILMGDTAEKIAKAVDCAPNFYKNDIEIFFVKNMEEAVEIAYKNAEAGDIISMSPASASFDLYKNFDERGKHFKKLVNSLK